MGKINAATNRVQIVSRGAIFLSVQKVIKLA